jgi:hypothetical protein
VCVPQVNENVPPTRMLKARFGGSSAEREAALSDSELGRVLRVMCRPGRHLRPPADVADQTLALLERGGSAHEACRRLVDQLQADDSRQQFYAMLLEA